MNIILTSIHISKSPDAIPLAPTLLKGYLLENINNYELNIYIKESTLKESMDIFINNIMDKKPDIVGLSIYLWNREYYIKLAKKLKQINPDLIIIAGGAETRSDYITLLNNNIDYTIQGEGEEVFFELIESIINNNNCTHIDGVNDNISRFISDLNTIPSPLINNYIDLKNYDGYLWELSRGCPFSCDFCFESRGSSGVRYYNLSRIEKELNIITNNNVPQVFVLDPTFNKDLKRAKSILNLIKKNNKGTHFHFEVRAELLDLEISELFYDIGASLQIGIQSAHDGVLKLINRRIDRDKFRSKIELLNKTGAIFGLDLIYGLPGDNYLGFKESMEYVLSLQPNHVDIFPLSVLPGTALWDNSKKLELNYTQTVPYTVISSPTFSKNDMIKSELLKKACDFIYNECKSTGWLIQTCKEIKVTITDFIENFSIWSLNNPKMTDPDPISTVKLYINDKYKPKKYYLIMDIINYHTAYSKALLEEKIITSVPKSKIMKSIPVLSTTASLLRFSYPILDAFDMGFYTIKDIKDNFKKGSSKAISWFHSSGEVIFDCYTDTIMNYLDSIEGISTNFELSRDIDIDFLIFAQTSGLINFR